MASIMETPNGTWIAIIRRKGFKRITKTFKRKTDATRWAKSIEGAMDRGEYSPDRPSARVTTFNDAVKLFCEADDGLLKMSPNQQRSMPISFRHWAKHLGHLRLIDVTADAIQDATDHLAKRRRVSSAGNDMGQVSLSTVRRDLSTLGSLLKWLAQKRIIKSSPMRDVAKPVVNDERQRYLTTEELQRLLDACDKSATPELRVAVSLMLFTGMRKADVMGLQWGRVNLGDLPIQYTHDNGAMFTIPPRHCLIPRTKNTDPHLAPLEGMAYDALKAWSRTRRSFDPARLVFPGRDNHYQPLDLRTPWKTALRRAGIEGFRWHDGRHTFASFMLRSSVSLLELAKLTGHRDIKSVSRYAHIAPEHSSGLVDKMQDQVIPQVKK